MQLTKEGFHSWWNLPYTKAFRDLIDEDLEKLAHSSMTTDHASDVVAKAEAVGAYKALTEYKDMTFEFFSGIKEE